MGLIIGFGLGTVFDTNVLLGGGAPVADSELLLETGGTDAILLETGGTDAILLEQS